MYSMSLIEEGTITIKHKSKEKLYRARYAKRCSPVPELISVILFFGIMLLPVINISTFAFFSSNNAITWDDYYNSNSTHYHDFTSQNNTNTAFGARILQKPEDIKLLNVPIGKINLTLPFQNIPTNTIPMELFAESTMQVMYNTTGDFYYHFYYDIPRTTVNDVFFLTPLFPFILGLIQSNDTNFWNYVNFYMYLQDGDNNVAYGWKFCNTSSTSSSDFHSSTVSIGKQFSINYYDVDASVDPTTNATHNSPLDLNRIFPLLNYLLYDLEITIPNTALPPFTINQVLQLLGIDFTSAIWMNDQINGFYQWNQIPADRIGYIFQIKDGMQNTTILKYVNTTFGSFFSYNVGTMPIINFLSLNLLVGYVLSTTDTVGQIFLFDALIIALFVGVSSFVHSKLVPGNENIKEFEKICTSKMLTTKKK
jgi:hypothetical protein